MVMAVNRTVLHVSGFDLQLRARDLAWEFERYGRLIRCDIPALKHPSAQPYAFVEFRREDDAEDAYYDMHGRAIDGRRISVQWAKKPPSASWKHDGGFTNLERRPRYRGRENRASSRHTPPRRSPSPVSYRGRGERRSYDHPPSRSISPHGRNPSSRSISPKRGYDRPDSPGHKRGADRERDSSRREYDHEKDEKRSRSRSPVNDRIDRRADEEKRD